MDGSDFVTVAEFDRAIEFINQSQAETSRLLDRTSQNLEKVSRLLAVHLAQEEKDEAHRKVEVDSRHRHRNRMFAVAMVFLTVVVGALVPMLLRSLHLIGGVV